MSQQADDHHAHAKAGRAMAEPVDSTQVRDQAAQRAWDMMKLWKAHQDGELTLEEVGKAAPAFMVVPNDRRFQGTNQAQHCWNRYNEYLLCMKKHNNDYWPCAVARNYAEQICPQSWVETWDEEREEGAFAGVQNAGELEAEVPKPDE